MTENEEQPVQVVRRNKSRADKLGIDSKKNFTSRNKLENQITKIIKHATQSIRNQAALIKWQDIQYDLRIKP